MGRGFSLIAALLALAVTAHGLGQATVINRLSLPIAWTRVEAARETFDGENRVELWKAYAIYLKRYGDEVSGIQQRLEELREAEGGPFVLRPSAQQLRPLDSVATLSVQLQRLDDDFLTEVQDRGLCSALALTELKVERQSSRSRAELSRYVAPFYPSVTWDARSAVAKIAVSESARQAINEELSRHDAIVLPLLVQLESMSHRMFFNVAVALENEGWAPDTNGFLRRPVNELRDELVVLRAAWADASRAIMKKCRQVEKAHWDFVSATMSILPQRDQVAFLGISLPSLAALVDDGRMERLLDTAALDLNSSSDLNLIEAHLSRKLPLLVEIADACGDVREGREIFGNAQYSEALCKRIANLSQRLRQVNSATLESLVALLPRLAGSRDVLVAPPSLGLRETPSGVMRTAESQWLPKAPLSGPPLICNAESDNANALSLSELVRQANEDPRFANLLARWAKVHRILEPTEVDSLECDFAGVDEYCLEERAYLTAWQTAAEKEIRSRWTVAGSNSAWTPSPEWSNWLAVTRACPTLRYDPFGGCSSAWCFDVLSVLYGCQRDSCISFEQAFLARALPLLQARVEAWYDWRHAELSRRATDPIAREIKVRGCFDSPEARSFLERRNLALKELADSISNLRVAQGALIRLTLDSIRAIADGDAACATSVMSGIASVGDDAPAAKAFSTIAERALGSGSSAIPDSAELLAFLAALSRDELDLMLSRLDEPFPDEGAVDPQKAKSVMSAELRYAVRSRWTAFASAQALDYCAAAEHASGASKRLDAIQDEAKTP